MKVAVIGMGRLGKLLIEHLALDFDLHVYDRSSDSSTIKKLGAKVLKDWEDLYDFDAVIPVVPICAMEDVCQKMAPHLKKNAIVVDVCSVKVRPIEVMERILPDHVQILGTHPMFGPDSAGESLLGLKIVLCKVRIDNRRYIEIKGYLRKHGLKVIESSADEHDHQIAKTLFLPHFLGRVLMEFEAQREEIDTLGHRRLLKILKTVNNDSWQLFYDMYHFNPYAAEVLKSWTESAGNVARKLEK